jgi:hypothetical protein
MKIIAVLKHHRATGVGHQRRRRRAGFDDRTPWRQIATQDGNTGLLFERLVKRLDDFGVVVLRVRDVLAHGLAVLCSDQVPASQGLPAPAVMRLGVLDRQGWTSQIAAWLETPERVRTAKQAARDIARTLSQWRDTAAQIADIIQGITR